jgi:di/tricarboxylate transporter
MTGAGWITLGVVIVAVYVLARDLFSPALTILGAVVVLLALDVITPQQAFSGFSNPAPITVAALFVLAGAVEKTGALQPMVEAVLGSANGHRRLLTRITVPAAGASAFLNNTPIVAMFAPQVADWAERNGLSPSRFLMPLSFASILGGMVTLIGTSTNLVVSGLLEATGRPALGMFEMTPVGLPVALIGIVLIAVLAPTILRDRSSPHTQAVEQVREFAVNMDVVAGGPVDGLTVEDAGLRQLRGLFLVEVRRGPESISPVTPQTVLLGGDRLTFVGRAEEVVEVQWSRGLVSAEWDHVELFDSPDHTFFEVVVGEASPLTGKTLKEVEFRGQYQAAVVAIHRAGQRVKAKLGRVPLKVGDTLILLADPGFRERWRDRPDFLLVSQLGGSPPVPTTTAWLVGAIALGIIMSAATGLLPIITAAMLGAVALLGLRVISPKEARAAVDLDVIIVIAAAFGLAAAIESSGLAAVLAGIIVGGFGGLGAIGTLAGVVAATVILTELVTNNAAAVLLFPVAMTAATDVGADPRGFAIALAIAASASFLTPIGYQTNTMVYGAGGYRFSDYPRLGAPLTAIVIVAVVTLVGVMHML